MSPPSALASRVEALLGRLGARAAQRVTVLVATLLAATSVGPYRVIDDFVLSLIARGAGGSLGLHRGRLDLFTFTTGDPRNNRELMDAGLMLPWWTDPELKISFYRPLSSLTHVLDEALFPNSAVLMHLHSLAWFAAGLAVVGTLYRRFELSPSLAGLALALYAFDDAHGLTLSLLANRNALVAILFGCLALVLHDAARRGKSRLAGVLAPLALVLGLLGGEAAVGAVPYLIAYAVFRDPARPGGRALSLAPYFGVVVAWRLAWSFAGFGAKGSGAYVDPIGDPLAFAVTVPERLLVLFQGQFSVLQSDQAFLGPPSGRLAYAAVAALTTLAVCLTLAPILRRDPSSRFWALGSFLSLLPLAATFPSDRLLGFVGLGAMALVARLFEEFVRAMAAGERLSRARAVVIVGPIATHVVAAPVALPIRAASMELLGLSEERLTSGIPRDPSIEDKTVVVLAAPTLLFTNYIQGERATLGVPRPKHLYVLASASSPAEVTRTGEASLTVTPSRGFLYTLLERHYRGMRPLSVGDTVRLSAMTATVASATEDGRPHAVRFDFTEPLDHYVFVEFEGGKFVEKSLPPLGERRTLREEDFQKIVLEGALGSRFD